MRLGDGRYPTRPRDKVGAIVFVQSVAALFTLRCGSSRLHTHFYVVLHLVSARLWLRRGIASASFVVLIAGGACVHRHRPP